MYRTESYPKCTRIDEVIKTISIHPHHVCLWISRLSRTTTLAIYFFSLKFRTHNGSQNRDVHWSTLSSQSGVINSLPTERDRLLHHLWYCSTVVLFALTYIVICSQKVSYLSHALNKIHIRPMYCLIYCLEPVHAYSERVFRAPACQRALNGLVSKLRKNISLKLGEIRDMSYASSLSLFCRSAPWFSSITPAGGDIGLLSDEALTTDLKFTF